MKKKYMASLSKLYTITALIFVLLWTYYLQRLGGSRVQILQSGKLALNVCSNGIIDCITQLAYS